MISEKAFLNYSYNFNNLFYIYPPKIKEIVNEPNFWKYLTVLTQSQEEIEDFYTEQNIETKEYPTPLTFLLANAYNNEEYEKIVQDAFLFFTHESITFLFDVKSILIGDINQQLEKIKSKSELKIINESNFFEFQNAIRQMAGEKAVELPRENEDPRVKRIKAKARYRDKIKAKKSSSISLKTSLAAICCMNFGINPLNIGELSYASFKALMEIYQQKEEYELDINSILAGADSNKIKPKYWIRNIE